MSRGIVVVTGASTGIGAACVTHLSELGFDVYRGLREPSEDARALLLDVTDERHIAALRERFAGERVAGLVNNAGIAISAPIEFVPLADLRRQLEVNVVGLVAATQALAAPLRAGRGRIINIGSIGGRQASPFFGPYNASKFAVEALTDAMRGELAPSGITVTVVEPGAIRTPIWGKGRETEDHVLDSLGPDGQALYGERLRRVRELTKRLEHSGLEPDAVARVVGRALTSARPRTRYVVGLAARGQLLAGALLSDRTMDRLLARGMGL